MHGDLAMFFVGLGMALSMGVVTYLTRTGIWRSWYSRWPGDWRTERLILMMMPLGAIAGIAIMMMAFPADALVIHGLGQLLFVLNLLPAMWCALILPMPRWIYPRWIREPDSAER